MLPIKNENSQDGLLCCPSTDYATTLGRDNSTEWAGSVFQGFWEVSIQEQLSYLPGWEAEATITVAIFRAGFFMRTIP